MTVRKVGKVYHYEFEYRRKRYKGSTGQRTEEKALRVEQRAKDEAREEAHGIATVRRERTPSFSAWADHAFRHWPRPSKRPEEIAGRIRVCLEFWGRTPTAPRKPPAIPRPEPDRPYHDYRLLDPIQDPELILAFEAWMTARGLSGSRKNALRSTMSCLYRVAIHPAHRKRSRVEKNPFQGVTRDKRRVRTRVLSVDEIRRWMAAAPYHLRVAMAIAVWAPKFRRGNILALRFDEHIDAARARIVVRDHKADRTAPPLVAPIVPELAALLADVRRVNRSAYLVEYQGGPVQSVTTAVRASAEAAGLTYGRDAEDGVTFHTLRHSMATLLATVPTLSEQVRALVMGQTIQTVQGYTHLAAQQLVEPHRAIAAAAPIADLLGGLLGGPLDPRSRKHSGKLAIPRRVPRRKKAT